VDDTSGSGHRVIDGWIGRLVRFFVGPQHQLLHQPYCLDVEVTVHSGLQVFTSKTANQLCAPTHFLESSMLSIKSASKPSLRSGIVASPRIHASKRCGGTFRRRASSPRPIRSAAFRSKACFVVSSTASFHFFPTEAGDI